MKAIPMAAVLLTVGFLNARAADADPEVTAATVTQDERGTIRVSYTLSADAVVTLDVLTNGVSVGKALSHLSGDVNRSVTAGSGREIVWTQDPADGPSVTTSADFKLTAWPTNDTPDYVVVDLATSTRCRYRYYPSEAQLPGGALNPTYRTTHMLFRRIHAKGVQWSMGTGSTAHDVTLDHDYYLGVFEVTQGQQNQIQYCDKTATPVFTNGVAALRPMEGMSYRNAYESYRGQNKNVPGRHYPLEMNNGFFGFMCIATGEALGVFTFPTDAEWEFACRAGKPAGVWNDGSAETAENMPGRCSENATDGEPTICGSYPPNAWGLYDMHGNVAEWCLDWYQEDAAIAAYDGAVNAISTGEATSSIDGKVTNGNRVQRGGAWNSSAASCGSAVRGNRTHNYDQSCDGLRVTARLGLD